MSTGTGLVLAASRGLLLQAALEERFESSPICAPDVAAVGFAVSLCGVGVPILGGEVNSGRRWLVRC